MADEKDRTVAVAGCAIKPGEVITFTMPQGAFIHMSVDIPFKLALQNIHYRHTYFLEELRKIRQSAEIWHSHVPVILAMLHTGFTAEWFQDLLQKIREIPYGLKNPEVYISVPVEDLSNQKYADMPGITPTGTGPQILYNIVDAAVHAEGGYYQLAGYCIEPCTVAGVGESHKMTFKLKPTTLVDIVNASSNGGGGGGGSSGGDSGGGRSDKIGL